MKAGRAIRLSLLATLCLLLGAVTTVGVAWRLPWWVHRPWWAEQDPLAPATEVLNPSDPDGRWPSHWPARESFTRARLWGWQSEFACVFVGEDRWAMGETRIGLPFLALRSEYHGDPESAADLGGSRWRLKEWTWVSWLEGAERTTGTGCVYETVTYPCMPIFPGFALDTALYASAWYLLIFTPLPLYRTARRRFRVSRGMCPACGYDLKVSPGGVCPECGART